MFKGILSGLLTQSPWQIVSGPPEEVPRGPCNLGHTSGPPEQADHHTKPPDSILL